jgi:hypothetical protein
MDKYTNSPTIGFSFAGGQHEIARYQGAPRYAFESPGDHLLYEEVIARLGTPERLAQQPVFLTAVTASSHTPYVDPLGGANAPAQVWSYVQEELWWLYDRLLKAGFFENGLLVITGDHRKMLPISGSERSRYGDSAKARIPLVIVGAGIPEGVIDDRLFQQADLLRMLDRVPHLGTALSPFAMWVERYVYVFGVASNASRLEVFEPEDRGQHGYSLRLRGAEIEWVNPPPNALAIEGAIHRQRVAQQAQRAAMIQQDTVTFGRDLRPSDQSAGVLIGLSRGDDPRRDPDDPRGALKLFTAGSFSVKRAGDLAGLFEGPSTVTARGFLPVREDGEYWFSLTSSEESCLAIDKKMVLGCQRGVHEGMALLSAGSHRFDFRYVIGRQSQTPELRWLPPGTVKFTGFPERILLLPRE